MILRITFLQRLDRLDPEAFHRHWRDVHAPLAIKLQGLSLYHLNAVEGVLAGQPPEVLPLWPSDGVAQLGFADQAAMQNAGATPAGKADRANFIKTQQTLVCERLPGETAPASEQGLAKCMCFLQRRSGLDAPAFARDWLQGGSDAQLLRLPGLVGRVRNRVVDRWLEPWVSAPYDSMPIDGVEEWWFDSAAAREAAFASQALAALREQRSVFAGKEVALQLGALRVVG